MPVNSHRPCTCSGIFYVNITVIENMINCDRHIDYVCLEILKATIEMIISLDAEVSAMKIVVNLII